MNEQRINELMKKLDLTREEAIQLIIDDESDEMLPEQKELSEKAKAVKRYTAGDKTQTGKTGKSNSHCGRMESI